MAKYEYRRVWFWADLETYEDKQLLGTTVKENARFPNLEQFAEKLSDAIARLENDGYEIHTVMPMQGGSTLPSIGKSSGYLGDAGFSLTRGAVVIGRRLAAAE